MKKVDISYSIPHNKSIIFILNLERNTTSGVVEI